MRNCVLPFAWPPCWSPAHCKMPVSSVGARVACEGGAISDFYWCLVGWLLQFFRRLVDGQWLSGGWGVHNSKLWLSQKKSKLIHMENTSTITEQFLHFGSNRQWQIPESQQLLWTKCHSANTEQQAISNYFLYSCRWSSGVVPHWQFHWSHPPHEWACY